MQKIIESEQVILIPDKKVSLTVRFYADHRDALSNRSPASFSLETLGNPKSPEGLLLVVLKRGSFPQENFIDTQYTNVRLKVVIEGLRFVLPFFYQVDYLLDVFSDRIENLNVFPIYRDTYFFTEAYSQTELSIVANGIELSTPRLTNCFPLGCISQEPELTLLCTGILSPDTVFQQLFSSFREQKETTRQKRTKNNQCIHCGAAKIPLMLDCPSCQNAYA